MILDEIVVHNFGVFCGKHRADLSVKSEKKPIVLIGGLNGNGKTTLLRAVELVLYGPLAPSIRNSGESYDEHLLKWINRSVSANDGAAIEAAFRVTIDGEPKNYRVRRSWRAKGVGVTKRLDVYVDGTLDRVLSDTWRDHVERLIPSRLSHLFFFDGERIASLADPESSSDFLRAAVNSLLGVDLVNQLGVDLRVLERRKRKQTKEGPERQEIEALEEQAAEVEERRQELLQQRASLKNKHDRAKKRHREARASFQQAGGELFESRQQIEKGQSDLEAQYQAKKEQLLEMSGGTLPLLLLRDLLEEVREQAKQEHEAAHNASVVEDLRDRDSRLLSFLRSEKLPKTAIKKTESFLQSDREARHEKSQCERYLDLDEDGLARCEALLEDNLLQEAQRAQHLVTELERLSSELEEIERKLEAVPDTDSVAGVLRDLNEAQKEEVRLQHELDKIEEALTGLESRKSDVTARLDRLLQATEQAKFDNKDIVRFITHSERVRDILEQFKEELVGQSLGQLRDLILQGYRKLLRKKTLVSDLRIDKESFTLELWNGGRAPIPTERLSAGERQLLAVSMLWGLGRASGRLLPVIIDTPLGRLDSDHRVHLVERYFPYASHQTILLSTDEEIDRRYFEKVQSRISKTYRLDYDDASSGSTIVPGYFW